MGRHSSALVQMRPRSATVCTLGSAARRTGVAKGRCRSALSICLGSGPSGLSRKGNGWELVWVEERRLRVVGVMSRASPERQRNLPSRERKVRRAPASRARSAAVEETRRWPQVYLAARVRPFSRREHSIEACSFSPCSGRAYLGLQTAPGVQAETCAYVEESTTTLVQTSTGEGTSR